MATTTLLTFEQYLDLPDVEGVRRELDEGQVVEIARASALHGAIQGRVFHFLTVWQTQTGAAFHILQSTEFRLGPETSRAPDVSLVRKSTFAAMEKVRGVYVGVPELAVEVVSENDTAGDVGRKIKQYLEAGATAVWVFYPQTRHVTVHRRSGVTAPQVLEEPDLLPGLRIPVEAIFAGLDDLS
jgi:Uma2 family endonuclease